MGAAQFSPHVCEQLGHYVYRLIDPRDGSTFYVGRGQGNRVFEHALGQRRATELETSESLKLSTIRDIRAAGLEVQHVIHRHGLNEETAKEVEAALIDAYPGLTNLQPGYDDRRGVMHATEVITEYEAPVAEPHHELLLISINRSISRHDDLLDAVRFAWKLDPRKATKVEYVLAVQRGMIIGAFIADEWLPATPENFRTLWGAREGFRPREGRFGFIGREAPEEIRKLYCLKRLPDAFRKQGAANPIRYWNPLMGSKFLSQLGDLQFLKAGDKAGDDRI